MTHRLPAYTNPFRIKWFEWLINMLGFKKQIAIGKPSIII
jgi:hypothetical protein